MLKTIDITADDLHIHHARDALHILPLEMMSLETPGLRPLSLVKDSQLNTKVELFQGEDSGRGLVGWDGLSQVFPNHKSELVQDLPMLRSLATLPSFDVFSLRIGLRHLGVDVADHSYLTLSPKTQENLSAYMREFTKPLIMKIYGPGDMQAASDFTDLVRMFKNPDRKEALKNLRQMSQALNVGLQDIPSFLEDYGDMFLSVAYYRSNFNNAQAPMLDFIKWVDGIGENMYLARDKDLMARCRLAQESIETIHYSLINRLDIFQDRFGAFWDDINADSFHDIKQLITSNHQALGGALCGITVKMSAWERRFPQQQGAPNHRADFVMTEIIPGLSRITSLVEDIRV